MPQSECRLRNDRAVATASVGSPSARCASASPAAPGEEAHAPRGDPERSWHSRGEQQVLQTAAVIGKTFGEALLGRVMASVTAIDETALGAALSALAAAEVLYQAALYPQLEYSFKHPLTQEVAQRSQLRERRVRVHAAAAKVLEEEGGNLDERAAESAQHCAEAGAARRAARGHPRAAEGARPPRPPPAPPPLRPP